MVRQRPEVMAVAEAADKVVAVVVVKTEHFVMTAVVLVAEAVVLVDKVDKAVKEDEVVVVLSVFTDSIAILAP
jgi:hypothetical protein